METDKELIERAERAEADLLHSREANGWAAYHDALERAERAEAELGECQAAHETGTRAIAENKRLREALTRISCAYAFTPNSDLAILDACVSIARAALGEKE